MSNSSINITSPDQKSVIASTEPQNKTLKQESKTYSLSVKILSSLSLITLGTLAIVISFPANLPLSVAIGAIVAGTLGLILLGYLCRNSKAAISEPQEQCLPAMSETSKPIAASHNIGGTGTTVLKPQQPNNPPNTETVSPNNQSNSIKEERTEPKKK